VKLGIALGGGGARGAAHVSVVAAFERLGLRPDLLTGTSIGGLVAGMWASGLTSSEIRAFFEQLSVTQLLRRPGSDPALSSNRKLAALLQQTLACPTFDQLTIPLAVVAVDLVTRREVVIDEGELLPALLATSAFPLLLPPVRRGPMVLVDGGLLNNVPFDVARARGATYVVAVDLSNSLPYGTDQEIPPGNSLVERALAATQRTSLWRILSATTDIITTQSVNARKAIAPPDLIIRPAIGTIGLFDFHRLEEGLAAGETAIQGIVDQLDALVARKGAAEL
jgi:NTE family protein